MAKRSWSNLVFSTNGCARDPGRLRTPAKSGAFHSVPKYGAPQGAGDELKRSTSDSRPMAPPRWPRQGSRQFNLQVKR